jgi:glutathione S-transferase
MMYKLYWNPGSASMAPHAALEEIGAAYELAGLDFDRDEHKAAEYLKLNPNGRVPTLIHDGKAVYESAAILLYLCERHPEAKLMPLPGSPQRGHFLQWLFFLTNTVQEEMMHWWHADNYMDSEAGRAELKRIAERRLAGLYGQIWKTLAEPGPHLLGETFSAADIFLVMLCRWTRKMAMPATDWPELRRLVDSVSARPAWQRMMKAEGITWTGDIAA